MQAGLGVRRNGMRARENPERGGVMSVAERSLVLAQARVAERGQGGVVEAARGGDVADADRDVVEHGPILLSGGSLITAMTVRIRAQQSRLVNRHTG
jgi:hypothetical protein